MMLHPNYQALEWLLEWCHQQPRGDEPIRRIPIPIATEELPRRVCSMSHRSSSLLPHCSPPQ
jgi:hypothetical protein